MVNCSSCFCCMEEAEAEAEVEAEAETEWMHGMGIIVHSCIRTERPTDSQQECLGSITGNGLDE